jgi:glycosyltransferase involved in cell wall biosynthesis
MSNPTVSIIVPTFKSVRFIDRMIASVASQTFDDWELIIVDGASNDGTRELVETHQRRLGSRLIMIEQENQGCCVARNTGIDASRGRFVAFLDSDDEFLPRKLERQLDLFNARPDLGLVYCDFCYIDDKGQYHPSTFDTHAPLARQVPTETAGHNLCVCPPNLFDYLIQQYFIATIVGMVRREVLADDLRYPTDNPHGFSEWLFYLDVVRRCRAGYVNEPLCRHHFVDGSITRTSKIRNSVCHRQLLLSMIDRYSGTSAIARRTLRSQLADACRQLGFESYKHAEYAAATRYFAESLAAGVDASTILHLAQSFVRTATSPGSVGSEPLLRHT